MGQQFTVQPNGQRVVVPGSEPVRPPVSAPVPLPPQPGLGGLAKQVQADKTAKLLGLLMARQYPQFMGAAPNMAGQNQADQSPLDLLR